MSVFLNADSKVIVQGDRLRGSQVHRRMPASGTQIVGGVTPRKGGQTVEFEQTSVPVYNSVGEAVEATGPT